jgi:hypothetical protein
VFLSCGVPFVGTGGAVLQSNVSVTRVKRWFADLCSIEMPSHNPVAASVTE